VYQWLNHEPAGAVVELPMCGTADPGCIDESWYMYYSAYHWHPTVNGGGGFRPRDWDRRISALATYPDAPAWVEMRALHVRYVIIHRDFPNWNEVDRYLKTSESGLSARQFSVVRFGSDIALDLGKAATT
jgi:hypothetical protein